MVFMERIAHLDSSCVSRMKRSILIVHIHMFSTLLRLIVLML